MLSLIKQVIGKNKNTATGAQQAINYKHFSIYLPPEHKLPAYQSRHVKYDRFLPHLAAYIEPGSTVIDVGANVGDTLAAMADRNKNLKYVCIEADDVYFQYLLENINRIKKSLGELHVTPVYSLVGVGIKNASLEGKDGTKHVVIGAGDRVADSLDNIASRLHLTSVKLLKTDVDGFDWDVIDSGKELIYRQRPALFFECQSDNYTQLSKFKEMMLWLSHAGYTDWSIFDNYGGLMVRTQSIEPIFQLLNYLWQQNQKQSTRTIYYYDILATTTQDRRLIDLALASY